MAEKAIGSKLTGKQWLITMGVALSFAGTVGISYFFTYYYQLGIEAFSFNDTQLASIISAFSSMAVICYILGGVLADYVPSMLLIIASNVSTAILGAVVCSIPGYKTMLGLYYAMGVTACLFTSGAWIKYLTRVGNKDQEGRIFGFYYMMIGAFSLAAGIISSAVIAANSAVTGLRVMMILYIVMCAASCILLLVCDGKNVMVVGDKTNKFKLSMVPDLIKNPMFLIFLVTSMGLTMTTEITSYIQPLMKTFFAVPLAVISIIASFAANGTKVIAAPWAGSLTDKWHTATKTVQVCYLFFLVPLVVLLVTPWGASTWLIPVLCIVGIRTAFAMCQPTRNSLMSETRIPKAARGTAVGIFSAVVTLPDTFMYKIGAKILENGSNSVGAYRKLIVTFIVAGLICNAFLWIFMAMLKKKKEYEAIHGVDPALEAR